MAGAAVETVIFGGGAAGLWLLDELLRTGRPAILLETQALGEGQTIACQGILHSGLKYSLQGLLTQAARQARDMPALWRRCLDGDSEPQLVNTEVLSPSFYLWGHDSAASRLGLVGARLGLYVTPRRVAPAACPPVLRGCRGTVLQVDEQVLSPTSLIDDLAERTHGFVYQIDARDGARFTRTADGCQVRLRCGGRELDVAARTVVLLAGQGNAALREQLGLSPTAMQRRPLHMVLARGPLPEFYGHCIDGASTRVSITSGRDADGRTVWAIGGQIAESGTAWEQSELVRRAQAEIRAVLPGLDLAGTEWSSFRIDRAEGATSSGGRPDSFKMLREGRIITGWPTKLVLVPQLVQAIAAEIGESRETSQTLPEELRSWPRPVTARPPWDRPLAWSGYERQRQAA